MAAKLILAGKRFGRLLVIEKTKAKSTASSYWLCRCDCGKEHIASGCKINNGYTKSCGCLRHKAPPNKTHGMANKTRTYRTWKEMRQRCLNPKSDHWKWYGAKDVKICQRWLDSFPDFLKDMGERPEGQSLDRINPFGDYEPSNCRWATQKEQMNNTRHHYEKKNAPWQK